MSSPLSSSHLRFQRRGEGAQKNWGRYTHGEGWKEEEKGGGEKKQEGRGDRRGIRLKVAVSG
eukprot:6205095-Pleurochrysis_carterae.AAC.1